MDRPCRQTEPRTVANDDYATFCKLNIPVLKLRRRPPERKFVTRWCREHPCPMSSVDTEYLSGNFRMTRNSDAVIVRCLPACSHGGTVAPSGELRAVGGAV